MQYAPRLPKKLGRKELKRVIDRVAAALQRLHRLGRLHCDVKRENIGLADGIAVLLDFGSLRRIAAARQHPERVGTWPNMAPEVRDALLLDIRADVYSLGCTFNLDSSVECLTQRRREAESAENARNLANTMSYASNLLEAKHHLKGETTNCSGHCDKTTNLQFSQHSLPLCASA